MRMLILLAALLLMTACQKLQNTPPIDNDNTKLGLIFESYFSQAMERAPAIAARIGLKQYHDRFNPPISLEGISEQKLFVENYLARLNMVDYQQLSSENKISYDIFKQQRQQELERLQHPEHLMPLNTMIGWHLDMAYDATGRSITPFDTEQDYLNFITKMESYLVYLESVEKMMALGIETNIVMPKIAAVRLLEQFELHIVEQAKDSQFYLPIIHLPKSFSSILKSKLTKSYVNLIENKVIPAYRRMSSFLINDYIPASRQTIGLSSLPNGLAWYETILREYTSNDMSAEKVHQMGLDEVADIHRKMLRIKNTTGFTSSLNEFFDYLKNEPKFYFDSKEELLEAYRQAKAKIEPELGKLFKQLPKEDFVIKPTDKSIEKYTSGAQYNIKPRNTDKQSYFAINTYDLRRQPRYLVETLTVHEGSPGHHFQLTIQAERENIPLFQQFSGTTAFIEGWALYAETLGYALGLYTDPYMEWGHLEDQLLRAVRLVVDTGIHSKQWSYQQAIDYITQNTVYSESKANDMVLRYVAWPAQALSYKIGQKTIMSLEEKARNALAKDYDIRDFHFQVLKDGAVSMEILTKKINLWIESERKNADSANSSISG
jgi:uncharacterized protein (DUF885 family)